MRPARALDVFTLWKQPEVPLGLVEGDWADYRFQVTVSGRQEQSLTRVACLGKEAGTDAAGWVVEVVPLREETSGRLVPVPGEGLRLRLSRQLVLREGNLLDHVLEARQWTAGRMTTLTPEDLRRDPLLADSFNEEFTASTVTRGTATTRVVGGAQYFCDQLVMAAADTQVARLPAGEVRQVTTRELTAAINADLPFLGLAYASERVRSESSVEPADGRLRPPPGRIRIEIMELVAHGLGARPSLGEGD
ncbi:MAG: hypothetical protein IPK64_05940 [bacterium]|nr:hypothetical protein [bacterium]